MKFYEKAGKVYLTENTDNDDNDDRVYIMDKDDFDVLMPDIEKDELLDQILKFYCERM